MFRVRRIKSGQVAAVEKSKTQKKAEKSDEEELSDDYAPFAGAVARGTRKFSPIGFLVLNPEEYGAHILLTGHVRNQGRGNLFAFEAPSLEVFWGN